MVPTVSPSPAVIVATDGAVLMVSLSPTWAMVRWTRTILSGNDRCHAVALAGTQPGPPSGGPPARGPPGAPAGKFPGPGPPGPGAARGAPGGPKWPPAGAPKWALFGPSSYIKYNRKWGVQGGTPLGVLLGPGGPGGPGGPKIGGPPGNGPSRAHTPTSVPTGRVIKYPRKCTPPPPRGVPGGPPGGPPRGGPGTPPRGAHFDPLPGGSRGAPPWGSLGAPVPGDATGAPWAPSSIGGLSVPVPTLRV